MMMEDINKYLKKLELEPPANDEKIYEIQQILNFVFPDDYQSFMKHSNGAEGMVGDNAYLQLWSLDNLAEYNEGYEVSEYLPGLILIGSDGGGEAYAYDNRYDHKPIVQVPFISINFDGLIKCADRFEGFLKYLYEQE